VNFAGLRESYQSKGYALVPGLIPPEVAIGFLARLQGELSRHNIGIAQLLQASDLLQAPAAEISSNQYAPIAGFLWGMTPAIAAITGEDLLPTYGYLRIYRQGDICRVHGDRLACEHSVSLTLAYSDDQPWALEVSPLRTDKPYQRADDQFRPNEQADAAMMRPGDGVLYQGVHHHHARTTPNPNAWSAHVFLHWVSRDGPYADQAFDGQVPPSRVELK
jgi:hypothetical protein